MYAITHYSQITMEKVVIRYVSVTLTLLYNAISGHSVHSRDFLNSNYVEIATPQPTSNTSSK